MAEGDPEEPETFSLKARIGKTVAREEKELIGRVLTKTNWKAPVFSAIKARACSPA